MVAVRKISYKILRILLLSTELILAKLFSRSSTDQAFLVVACIQDCQNLIQFDATTCSSKSVDRCSSSIFWEDMCSTSPSYPSTRWFNRATCFCHCRLEWYKSVRDVSLAASRCAYSEESVLPAVVLALVKEWFSPIQALATSYRACTWASFAAFSCTLSRTCCCSARCNSCFIYLRCSCNCFSSSCSSLLAHTYWFSCAEIPRHHLASESSSCAWKRSLFKESCDADRTFKISLVLWINIWCLLWRALSFLSSTHPL